jgi:nicotinamide-nucleotide amidase
MAEGVRRLAKADAGLSTTGIAGPAGGTASKPVGLVYVGYADAVESAVQEHRYANDRLGNKERFAQAALNLLRLKLREKAGHGG